MSHICNGSGFLKIIFVINLNFAYLLITILTIPFYKIKGNNPHVDQQYTLSYTIKYLRLFLSSLAPAITIFLSSKTTHSTFYNHRIKKRLKLRRNSNAEGSNICLTENKRSVDCTIKASPDRNCKCEQRKLFLLSFKTLVWCSKVVMLIPLLLGWLSKILVKKKFDQLNASLNLCFKKL